MKDSSSWVISPKNDLRLFGVTQQNLHQRQMYCPVLIRLLSQFLASFFSFLSHSLLIFEEKKYQLTDTEFWNIWNNGPCARWIARIRYKRNLLLHQHLFDFTVYLIINDTQVWTKYLYLCTCINRDNNWILYSVQGGASQRKKHRSKKGRILFYKSGELLVCQCAPS